MATAKQCMHKIYIHLEVIGSRPAFTLISRSSPCSTVRDIVEGFAAAYAAKHGAAGRLHPYNLLLRPADKANPVASNIPIARAVKAGCDAYISEQPAQLTCQSEDQAAAPASGSHTDPLRHEPREPQQVAATPAIADATTMEQLAADLKVKLPPDLEQAARQVHL